jgi:spore germination protein
MFASSITEQGVGNYEVTHTILNSPDLQTKLIDNILSVLKGKGYYGLEITLVFVLPEDLPHYVAFVSDVTSRLNTEGFEVFISLLPSTFGYQPGVPYEYSYYSDIGKVVNYVILISFLWSTAFVPQVAQTGAEYTKEYVDFAVTQIPPEKIFVGLTRMAYDWELPYVEGETPGRLITSFGALTLANQLGTPLEFDESTQTPYYYYTESGIEHFVWFKDGKTVQALVNLIPEYGLRGLAVWNIMYYYSPTWLVLNSQYDISNIIKDSFS